METQLISVTERELSALAALAGRVWHAHYDALIGPEQVRYMLEKFQSASAVRAQLAAGARYFLLLVSGCPAGYYAYERREDHVFLSKLYVEEGCRGKGLGRLMVNDLLKRFPGQPVQLTVNKENAGAIAAYEAMGFRTVHSVKTDIGNGFFMDDYVMRRG